MKNKPETFLLNCYSGAAFGPTAPSAAFLGNLFLVKCSCEHQMDMGFLDRAFLFWCKLNETSDVTLLRTHPVPLCFSTGVRKKPCVTAAAAGGIIQRGLGHVPSPSVNISQFLHSLTWSKTKKLPTRHIHLRFFWPEANKRGILHILPFYIINKSVIFCCKWSYVISNHVLMPLTTAAYSRSVHRGLHCWKHRFPVAHDHHRSGGHFIRSSLHFPQEPTGKRGENRKSSTDTRTSIHCGNGDRAAGGGPTSILGAVLHPAPKMLWR